MADVLDRQVREVRIEFPDACLRVVLTLDHAARKALYDGGVFHNVPREIVIARAISEYVCKGCVCFIHTVLHYFAAGRNAGAFLPSHSLSAACDSNSPT